MRDDLRRPQPASGQPSQPAAPASSPQRGLQPERHPALRPRLGDLGEEELRAFSARAKASAPEGREEPEAQEEKPTPRSRRASKAVQAPNAPTEHKGPKMVRRPGSGRARLKKFALLVLLPGAVAGGAGWAMTSPRLAVSGVDVAGLDATPQGQVQLISAALVGQNWLRADIAAARSRLSKLPTVQAASVSRAWNHWPPRLSVRIQERRPWLRLGGGASWWIVDRSGVAFRRATRDDQNLYAITSTAFDPESQSVGQAVPPKIWDGVRRLALALDQSSREGGPWQLKRAYLDRDNMASMRLRGGSQDGLLVRLGDGVWPQKMERARRALLFFEAAGRRAQSLNLVSFSMPTWTPLAPRPQSTEAPQASTHEGQSSARPASLHPDNTSNAAPTTPPDTSDSASEGSPEAPSTYSGEDEAPAAARPDAAGKRAPSGSKKRGEPDGADQAA